MEEIIFFNDIVWRTTTIILPKFHKLGIMEYSNEEIQLNDYPGSPEKLIQIVQKLAERVEKFRKLKFEAVAEKDYGYAATCREEEISGMNRIMRLLLFAERESFGFEQKL